MSELNLPACPICHAEDNLTHETMERAGQPFTWYECQECGSVLLWLGDDQWAYQKVGREDKAYLLKQPMASDELASLLPWVEEKPISAAGMEEPSDADRTVPSEVQVPSEGRRAKPSRLLQVGLVVTIIGFIVGVILLLVLLSPDGKSTSQQASEPEGTPTSAFAEGDEVILLSASGKDMTLLRMETGCQPMKGQALAAPGVKATVGSGRCYHAEEEEYYFHVVLSDNRGEGWVRASEIILPGEHSLPSSTRAPARSLSTPRPSEAKLGWLCDYDGTGRIRLWTAASGDATVKDVVGTCVACCVDVMMYESELADNGILFYRISVGGQSGWVDLDYYYRNKPAWSSN